mgnify:CR=1 FL=1
MEFTVQPYTADQEAAWDRFVMQESGNGTFLQTRNFLNYHPAGRFEDASLIVTNEHDAIVAVVPAAVQQRDGKRTFVSHPGSTYGGPVLREAYNTAARAIGILQAIDAYVAAHYEAAIFRPTVGLLEKEENQTLLYAFTYLGYTKRHFHTARLLYIQIVYKDTLRRFRAEINLHGSFRSRTHFSREHQIELANLGPVFSS